jgi:hypothetical protein
MLAEIKKEVESIGEVSVRKFLIDFEMSVMKGIHQVFGSGVTISGCFVHF